MSKAVLKNSRTLLLGLLIALLLINTLVLAPEVGAASDANKTETDLTLTENTPTAEADVLTHRAITMDEAKKEAQAAVDEQLAIIAAVEEEDEEEDVIETQTEDVDVSGSSNDSEEASAPATGSSTTDDEQKASAVPTTQTQTVSTVSSTTSSDFLMSIDNPDPNYVGRAVALTDYDRDLCERIIMGEMGGSSFTGMALVAQCIRDTYIKGHYTNIADVLYENGYYGSMNITPTQTCKDVVSYIFDQGGSAVQHRIQVFYASNYCSSPWHETQDYVCSYGYVRFFDMYY